MGCPLQDGYEYNKGILVRQGVVSSCCLVTDERFCYAMCMLGGIKKRIFVTGTIGVATLAIAAVVFFLLHRTSTTQEVTPVLSVVPVSGMVIASSEPLHVQTLAGKTDVAKDGSFTVDGFDGGRHLAVVKNDTGDLLYVGLVNAQTKEELGPKSTAVVMLFYASGGMFLPFDAWPAVLDATESFVKSDTIGDELTQIAARDPKFLTDDNTDFLAAMDSAATRFKTQPATVSFFSIPVAHASGFTPDSTPKSGIRIDRGGFNKEIYVTNEYRRILRSLVYEIGYKKDGVDHMDDTVTLKAGSDGHMLFSFQPKYTVDTPTIGKLTDVPSTLIDYFLLSKVHYGEAKSDSVYLEPEHADADATYYRIMTLGWGLQPPSMSGPYLHGELTFEEEQAYRDVRNLTIVHEILLPMIMIGLSTDKARDIVGEGGQGLATDIAQLLFSDPRADGEGAKAMTEAFDKGDIKGGLKNSFEFFSKSKTFQALVSQVILNYIKAKTASYIGDGVEILGEFLAKPIEVAGWVLKGFDSSVLATNFALASQASEFTIAVAPPHVSITSPNGTTGLRIGMNYQMEAQVELGDQNAKVQYVWTHEKKGTGHLTVGQWPDLQNGDEVSNTSPYALYTKDVESGGDTVTLKAYGYTDLGAKVQKVYLGTASVTLKDDERGSCGNGDWKLPSGTKVVLGSFTPQYASRFFNLKQGELLDTLKINGPQRTKFQVQFNAKDGYRKGVKLADDAFFGKDAGELLDNRDYYVFIVDKNFTFDLLDLAGTEIDDLGQFVWSGTRRSVTQDITVRLLDVVNESDGPYTMWYDCWPYWIFDPKSGRLLH